LRFNSINTKVCYWTISCNLFFKTFNSPIFSLF